MPRTNSITKKLEQVSERMTPVRAALIEVLSGSKAPLTPQELLGALGKRGLKKVNKTTVYRQLETLLRQRIIREVRFADRSKRYELVENDGHHHHLVCLVCGHVEDVELPTDLAQYEKNILKKNHFEVLEHSLEFFGRCSTCRAKKKTVRER